MLFFGHLGITLLIVFVVFSMLKKDIDYRFVLVGSLLPVIIDKPLGQYILGWYFQNGRIIAHTLLFLVVLTIIGLFVARKDKTGFVVALAAGTVCHLVLDQMWLAPGTLFWPLFGWEFPKLDLGNYLWYLLSEMFSRPDVYVPELIGLGILVGFAYYFKMYKPENIKAFILSGRLVNKPVIEVPVVAK
jgi:inner membrane protein